MWLGWVERLANAVSAAVEESAASVSRRTQRLMMKLITMVIGAGVLLISLLVFTVTLFFQLADLPQFVNPALYTGLIVLVLGAVIMMVGGNQD